MKCLLLAPPPKPTPTRGEGTHRPHGTILAHQSCATPLGLGYSITSATTFLPRNDAVEPIASTNGIASAQIAASSA